MKLEIADDTSLDISCYITGDGKRYCHNPGKQSVLYDFDSSKTPEIRIFKEDIWASERGMSKFMPIVYIFDWISGVFSESRNLPFSIDHRLSPEMRSADPRVKVSLSDIVRVDRESLTRWSKYSLIQCAAVAAAIVIIGCLLSLIFSGWIRIVFAVCAAVVAAVVFGLIDSRRKKLFRALKTYVKP